MKKVLYNSDTERTFTVPFHIKVTLYVNLLFLGGFILNSKKKWGVTIKGRFKSV